MIIINIAAIAAGISVGLLLIYYLVRIIGLMRKIATNLATVRLLLKTVASQTEEVPDFVVGIATNVATLDRTVDQLAAGLGVRTRGAQ